MLQCCPLTGEDLTVSEFLAVGDVYDALLFYAVKGGERSQRVRRLWLKQIKDRSAVPPRSGGMPGTAGTHGAGAVRASVRGQKSRERSGRPGKRPQISPLGVGQGGK